MRSAAEIFQEVRFNTGNENDDRFTDARLMVYLNHAIREIQKTIFLSNPINCPFNKISNILIVDGQEEYVLPTDIFAISSITDIKLFDSASGRHSKSLRRVPVSERGQGFGYCVVNKSIFVSPARYSGVYNYLKMTYMPTLALIDDVDQVPDLPEVCEEYLTLYLERKIQAVDSSNDLTVAVTFTREQKDSLASLFTINSSDADNVPILDDSYLN